jgi:D-glycero-D-manno-heptose 1,7-bisphosphate phosphatase
LDGIYYCPHHPDIGEPPYRASCDCRKPLPGLLYQAAQDLNLGLEQSTMIGDSLRDLEAGAAAGCRTLMLVRTGHGTAQEAATLAVRLEPAPLICDDLASAVDHLLSSKKPASQPATPHPAASQPVKSGARPA